MGVVNAVSKCNVYIHVIYAVCGDGDHVLNQMKISGILWDKFLVFVLETNHLISVQNIKRYKTTKTRNKFTLRL